MSTHPVGRCVIILSLMLVALVSCTSLNPVPPTATPTAAASGGGAIGETYIVKQIESLGHETLSGQVCSLTQPFSATYVEGKITFLFNFVPENARHGTWKYAYAVKKAGETHAASGSYTLSDSTEYGTLILSLDGSDHVVLKDFDGLMPINYRFNLVPSRVTGCPGY